MLLSWDENKRQVNIERRRLDFADAAQVFSGYVQQSIDDRFDYGEERIISIGLLDDAVVVVVWTERDGGRRIISMRKADDDERHDYRTGMD